ncbi:MAG TPA: leucine-rich repeat domain-containing protein [Pyrinomonadaceae bacterium]
MTHFAVGLLSLHLFVGGAGGAARGGVPQDGGAFDSLEKALRTPERVRRLAIQGGEELELKHLPPGLGRLVNLEALELACLEKLEDLPEELGQLQKLRELVIDNGNGCSMNVALPRSVGRLAGLRVLRLYGALDGRDTGPEGPARDAQSRLLPDTLGELQNLEELDLGRNGIKSVPQQVATLRGLKKLSLDYNDIRELPSFVGDLPNLRELSVNANGGVVLPPSLAKIKGLKVFLGNNRLKLRDQKALRARFPDAVFSFENEFDDDAANEEAPKPKGRRR